MLLGIAAVIAEITVGVAVGTLAADAVDKYVVEPIHKIVETKKEKEEDK